MPVQVAVIVVILDRVVVVVVIRSNTSSNYTRAIGFNLKVRLKEDFETCFCCLKFGIFACCCGEPNQACPFGNM